MKYTQYGFQQKYAVDLGLDTIDLSILRFFVDFIGTGKMEKVTITGTEYYWIYYQKVIDELPILGIKTKDGIYRRFMKLCDAGVLQHHVIRQKDNTRSFYAINSEGYLPLVTIPDVEDNQNAGGKPRGGADFFPHGTDEKPGGSGISSETPRMKSRTDPSTSIILPTKDNRDAGRSRRGRSPSPGRDDLRNQLKELFRRGSLSMSASGVAYYHDTKEAGALEEIINRGINSSGGNMTRAESVIMERIEEFYRRIERSQSGFWAEMTFCPSQMIPHWNKLEPRRHTPAPAKPKITTDDVREFSVQRYIGFSDKDLTELREFGTITQSLYDAIIERKQQEAI